MKIDVAGLKIDAIAKSDLLQQLTERIKRKEKTFVTTPYSEFLYASLRDSKVRSLLNKADFAVADGVGILWAHSFLGQPFSTSAYYMKILQAWLQVIYSGASILLNPHSLYKTIPEKIVGADLIWDLAGMAATNGFTVFLLGSKGDIPAKAAHKLQERFPKLQIVGTSNKGPDDSTVIDDINRARPDVLLVTYNRLVQEQWIAKNLDKTTASLGIGLGGTFDYISGAKKQPPVFIRKAGLEWLYRLITQPTRIVRIYEGVWGLIISLVRYKVFSSYPLRPNVSVLVVNNEGKVFVGRQAEYNNRKYFGQIYDEAVWLLPQGGLEKGEDLVEGAKRELREETGITHVQVLGEARFVNQYVWNNASRLLSFKAYRHKGQIQHTVFFKFTGRAEEIKLDTNELIDYRWVPVEEVVDTVAPIRRSHVAAVLAELSKIPV